LGPAVKPNKSARRREFQRILDGQFKGSIERTRQNISALLLAAWLSQQSMHTSWGALMSCHSASSQTRSCAASPSDSATVKRVEKETSSQSKYGVPPVPRPPTHWWFLDQATQLVPDFERPHSGAARISSRGSRTDP
jgi:hypothetical protein